LIRLQSQTSRVRPPRRQQQGAKNPLRQIQATIPTENEYTEVHTNLSEQELRRLKRAQSMQTKHSLSHATLRDNFSLSISVSNTPLTRNGTRLNLSGPDRDQEKEVTGAGAESGPKKLSPTHVYS
jgi:hypothetical protein